MSEIPIQLTRMAVAATQEPLPPVLFAGPLPPAVGGMATIIGDLAQSSLAGRVDLRQFNTGKTTPPGRPLWRGIWARLTLLGRWWQAVGAVPRPLVHIHTCSGFSYFMDSVLLWLASWRGCVTVLHIHGARFDEFLAGLPPPLKWFAQGVARRADRVVVLSPEWREKLAGPLKGARLTIVRNGVPPAVPEAEAATPHERFTLLFLGNLSRRKGVLELVEALSGLPENVHLDLAGGEDDIGIAREIEALAAARGLQARVKLLGPVRGPAKQACWRAADAFVLPSHAEGVPIAMLEAMSAGLPVVATSVGGIPTVIQDRVNGRLVMPGDVAGLHAALAELVADPDLRVALGQAAQRRWRDQFSIEHTVAELLQLYAVLRCEGRPDRT